MVVQHRVVSHHTTALFSELGGSIMLRISDPLRGYWRGLGAGRPLDRYDWQYRQPHKVWLNGDNRSQTWDGFPQAPVVIVATKYSGRADGPDFVYRIGGGDRGFDGLLGELLVYYRELSLEEVQELHQYLSLKWGVSAVAPRNAEL